MRVLVTGGTGFIGSATTRRLLARGHEVVVLTRRAGGSGGVGGARVVVGDLLGSDGLDEALRGCAAVVHCAGRPGPATRSLFRRLHVEGTERLIDAAERAGVGRVVNIASQGVLFGGKDLIGVGDNCPYPERYIDPYCRTKAAGERVVLGANGRGGMKTISLRPAVVWGRGDRTVLPIMVKLARGPGIPAAGPGTNIEATTHIENLVDAIVAGVEGTGGGGSAMLVLDDFSVTWREFLSRSVEAAGVRARFLRVPASVAGPAAWALDGVSGNLGLPVPLAYFGVRTAVTSRRFVPTRAREVLGYSARVGWEEGLADLKAWVEEVGGWRGLV